MSGPIGPPLTNEAHWRKFVRQLRLHGFDESIIEQLEAFRAAATGTVVTQGIKHGRRADLATRGQPRTGFGATQALQKGRRQGVSSCRFR
jgi:hypothetical protein